MNYKSRSGKIIVIPANATKEQIARIKSFADLGQDGKAQQEVARITTGGGNAGSNGTPPTGGGSTVNYAAVLPDLQTSRADLIKKIHAAGGQGKNPALDKQLQQLDAQIRTARKRSANGGAGQNGGDNGGGGRQQRAREAR
jgi:hypothetical protein